MNVIPSLSVIPACLIALAALHPAPAGAQTADPAIPVGSLDATPRKVQPNTYPKLAWNITYPSVVKDIVTVTPPGTLTPKQDLNMTVRVLGASVADSKKYYSVEAQASYNNGSYARIFYGTQTQVNPNTIVYSKIPASKNKPINFGGRYYNSGWSTFYTSQNSANNVVALVNGDTPPTTYPLYQQPTLESFLKPYLDSQGRVKIGPMDVIYLIELTHTNRNDTGFDLQDLVLLVTFSKITP